MTVLVEQTLDGIFDALSDAIEGGNSWRGSGTAMTGIPGQFSNDPDLPLIITATGGSTTKVQDSSRNWPTTKWSSGNGPPYFLLAKSGTAANVGQHRKISSWSGPDYTTGNALTFDSTDPELGENGGREIGDFVMIVATEAVDGEMDNDTITVHYASEFVTVLLLWTPEKGAHHYIGVLRTTLPASWDSNAISVTEYVDSTNRSFTTTAFSSAVQANDTFSVLQGFKRAPNSTDIESDAGISGGFDRYFHLSADAGKRTGWSGAGAWTLETELYLRVRFLKYARVHDWVASAITNMGILRAGLARIANYDATYMRALIPDGSIRVVADDQVKIVVEDTFKLFYRLNTSFL